MCELLSGQEPVWPLILCLTRVVALMEEEWERQRNGSFYAGSDHQKHPRGVPLVGARCEALPRQAWHEVGSVGTLAKDF